MNRVDELRYKSHKMELEEDFYSFDFDTEELPVYQDSNELLAALRQKEEEVILAAQLGNALLLENRQLKEESDKLHEQYADKLEALEQGRYDLRVKLDGCQADWEGQVAELERDVRELSAQVERLTLALGEAERNKTLAQDELGEQSQRLQEQLRTAMEVERAVTTELQVLKQELHQRGYSRPQDEELLSAMREQVVRLTQKEQALEQRMETVCQENAGLRDRLASLHTRLALQEQQNQTQTQQLAEAWKEVEAARGRSQELQTQVEELQEEVSLQERSQGEASLLSELEHSLDRMGLGQDKEQVTQEVTSILNLLLPLAQSPEEFRGEDEGLQGMLVQLRSVAEKLVHSETLQNVRLREENAQLKLRAENRLDEEIVQQAIKDRDEAIAKKTAVEAELVRSKNDMMCLNNQLLEAIQRKLALSQELEAWQDDIQVIINQQLRTQQQSEQTQRKTGGHPLSFLRRSRRPSSSPSCASEPAQERPQVPWRDWLKRGK